MAGVLVVGGGRMGALRMGILSRLDRARLVGFVDKSPELRAAVSAQYAIPCFEHYSEAISAGIGASAAWISAPTAHHRDLIVQAAEAGHHVAVEKPVSDSSTSVIESYKACAQAGVQLFCSFQRRFDPHYTKLAEHVHSGALGRPTVVHTVFRDSPCPPIEFLKTGGDPFHDLFVHDMDYVRWLMGPADRVTEVYASGTSFNPELKAAGVMDTAVTRVAFESGAVYNGEFTRSSSYGYDQRCEVYGETGSMARLLNPPASELEVCGPAGQVRDQVVFSFLERFPAAYQAEVEHFLDVIQEQAPLKVTEQDALMAGVLSEAALQSAKRGAVVKLSYPDGQLPQFSTVETTNGKLAQHSWEASF